MYDHEELVTVAAGVLRRDGKVLICQRGINHRYGLKWEFPGGKAIQGERMTECLERELEEQLDIRPVKAKELRTIQATYPDGGKFQITFYLVTSWEGEVSNNVFENIAWVTLDDISNYEMLQGSLPILPFL